jgi:hypothetical protein
VRCTAVAYSKGQVRRYCDEIRRYLSGYKVALQTYLARGRSALTLSPPTPYPPSSEVRMVCSVTHSDSLFYSSLRYLHPFHSLVPSFLPSCVPSRHLSLLLSVPLGYGKGLELEGPRSPHPLTVRFLGLCVCKSSPRLCGRWREREGRERE